MTLIKSISGIRGTIGGKPEDNLTPLDTVRFASAYGTWIKQTHSKAKVVIGRDARVSGQMISDLVCSTLIGLGIDVIDLGLSTTPTVEMAVVFEKAQGGIILTASHNPAQWNALKLLNEKGEFISGAAGQLILEIAENNAYDYATYDQLGTITKDDTYIQKHINAILALPYVDVELIKSKNFKIAIDCVNSTGGISLPPLLQQLGVTQVKELYCEPNGLFPHNPEPLAEHLTELCAVIKEGGYDMGITVDPDVDRLAFVSENGEMFGEEYTLVAVADFMLDLKVGNTVSNLSSSRALRDLTRAKGGQYTASAVGEVNVVAEMKAQNAVIGGEGNGGIILPDLHYGRDSLVGIALFLTHIARKNTTLSALKASYPQYFISKNKIDLTADLDVDLILQKVQEFYAKEEVTTIDGVKIDFEEGWVHLRKSNTEPIIRVYSESKNEQEANQLAQSVIDIVKKVSEQLA
jgi:phosphomannomutase